MTERQNARDIAERVEESVRHALALVGPGEIGVEFVDDGEDSAA